MPAVQRSEFALALNQVASERGVEVSVVLETVENAILAAYRKDHPGIELEEYRAELNQNTGEAHIFLKDKDVTPPGFGRIAAQTAKQVILQKIREKEKEAIMTDYKVKIGGLVNGHILRFAGPNIIIDIGKTEAIMPPQDQIAHEKYYLNQRMSMYLVEIREGMKGEEIVVSRSHPGLIEGLFKREVPEVAQGSVVIKEVVREAGNRSKVAVFSNQSGIDPVGSCVGQKGVRVQAIIQEFGGIEKIDIIQWSEDPKTYITQALSPAKNINVEIDEEAKVARVLAPKDELSLAIGKDGQNVRLASKLTGYRLEIEGVEEPTSNVDDVEESAEEIVKTEEPASTSNVAHANTVDAKEEKPKKAKKPKKEKAVKDDIADTDLVTDEVKNTETAEEAEPTLAEPVESTKGSEEPQAVTDEIKPE